MFEKLIFKKRGIILIISCLVVIVLLILGGAFVLVSISEKAMVERKKEISQAFYLAEAGIDRALNELRQNYNWSGVSSVSLGKGEYSVSVNAQDDKRIVISSGFIPNEEICRVRRNIEAVMRRTIPANFYNNAIYSSEDVDLNGNAYSVTGDIRYADGIDNTQNVNGTITRDPSISPLARLDFQQLYNISQSQNNVYDETRLKAVQRGEDSFPISFWYNQDLGIPNVVYVETDLELRGDIGTIGGFYAVVGDVLTNPSGEYDATINGNGQIDGSIYTRGEFEVNGGGGGLNVFGGVWSGSETELNGNAHIVYNQVYMEAIRALEINPDVQIISWREL